MQKLYTTTVHATGDGRNGHVQSDDGLIDTDVRHPKELGGSGDATNPEQLFAAGYSACFHSALRLIGQREGVDVTGTEVSATVSLGMLPSGGFGIAAELDVAIPTVDRATARIARGQGARGVPVLQRDPRQHRRRPHGRLTHPDPARRGRQRPARHQAARQFARELIVGDGLHAGNPRPDVARCPLHEPPPPGGKVVRHARRSERERVEVDQVQVGAHARGDDAAVGETVEAGRLRRLAVDDVLQRQPRTAGAVACPVREHERRHAAVADRPAVRSGIAQTRCGCRRAGSPRS